jgi:hypothetical protein
LEPAPCGPGLHVRVFGLVGFKDRLAVEPDRGPGAGALDLDRVPPGSRPRRVGGRALLPIDARASVLSPTMSGRPAPMPEGGIPVYPLLRVGGVPAQGFSRVTLDQRVPAVPASSGPRTKADTAKPPRRSVQRGSPSGPPEWQEEIAKRLGLE